MEAVSDRIDRAGHCHAGSEDHGAVDSRLVERLLDDAGGDGEGRVRVVVDVELGGTLGQHGTGEVRDDRADPRVIEIDADDDPGRRLEPQQHRRPAHGRRPHLARLAAVALSDEAPVMEVRHQRRDGRPRHAGDPGDVGPAEGAVAAQGVDDAKPVQLPQ